MNEKAAQRKIREYARQDLLAIEAAIRANLASYEGRKFLWRLFELGRVGTQPFSGNALTTAFGCGELNVGNGILQLISEVDPMAYGRMMQEHLDEHTRRYPDTRANPVVDSEPDPLTDA